MRIDHVSYAASHNQISDVVQRIGSRLGSTIVDGGIHPRFGTRNFILPLKGQQYIEIVCPLEHPASLQTPFGQMVSKKAEEGGGWLAWVIATDDISKIEERIGRRAVNSHRIKPDGNELKWKQLGIKETMEDSQLPFFIEWESRSHPSSEYSNNLEITKIDISGQANIVYEWVSKDFSQIKSNIEFEWHRPESSDGFTGILGITFSSNLGLVYLD